MRIVGIEDEEAFAALTPAWLALWERCPSATPFQFPAWLVGWRAHFRPGPLRCAAAFEDGALVGVFPFYLEDGAFGRRLLPVGISLSDYHDVLVDPSYPQAGPALVEYTRTAWTWDSWDWEDLPPSADAWRLPCPSELRETVSPSSACPVLALVGPDDLSGCVPARRRRQWRRARGFADARGTARIEAATDPDAFMDALARLHGARWTSRGEDGLLVQDSVEPFQRRALRGLMAAGVARCHLLTIDGRPVGAYYGFLARERAYAYLGGFDPDYAEASPGAILLGHAIVEAMRSGATEFHFLRGQEDYKYTWGAQDRWNQRRTWRRVPT